MQGKNEFAAGGVQLSPDDFRRQAEFRYQLRRFLRASEVHAKEVGLEANQYQLLLCVRGMPPELQPNITTLAKRLMIETHSVVELVDRCIEKGMAERYREGTDKRNVFIRLTPKGLAAVEKTAVQNRKEIGGSLPSFIEFLETLK